MAYVIKEWSVNQEANSNGKLVEIKGRESGLFAWILSLMKIDPTVGISIDENSFEFEEGSFSGTIRRTIPVNKISSVYYGYLKPWKSSIPPIVIGLVLLVPTFGISLILILWGIIKYFLNKTLSIGIVEVGGGIVSGIEMKRSIIEGKKVDEKDAEEVATILYNLINSKN